MRSIQRIMRGVIFIGQLGFSIITPPLVLTYLAYLAVSKLHWGIWVMVLAILLGIVTAFCSARSLLAKLVRPAKQSPPASFNDHA